MPNHVNQYPDAIVHSIEANEDLANRLIDLAGKLLFEAARLLEHDGVGLVAGSVAIKAQERWAAEHDGDTGKDGVNELEPGLNSDGITTRVGTYLSPNYFGHSV